MEHYSIKVRTFSKSDRQAYHMVWYEWSLRILLYVPLLWSLRVLLYVPLLWSLRVLLYVSLLWSLRVLLYVPLLLYTEYIHNKRPVKL